MSLLPFVFNNQWNSWDSWNLFSPLSIRDRVWSERILNRKFGLDAEEWEEFFGSSMPFDSTGRNRKEVAKRFEFLRFKYEPDMFSIVLDESQFAPNEITVKTVDNNIIITGKHGERRDAHGWVSRQFTRRHPLPEGRKEENVIWTLTPNGLLIIDAPKKWIELPAKNERIVPITIKETKETEGG